MADVKDLSAYKGVWVFAEQREGKIMPVVIELLGEGRKLADAVGCELCAVLLGDKVEGLTDELFAYGADKVYLADDPELKDYRTDAYSITIGKAIEEYKPEIVLLGATHIGRDLGPCLAVNCNTGLTADCTKLEIDPELVIPDPSGIRRKLNGNHHLPGSQTADVYRTSGCYGKSTVPGRP